MSWPRLFLVQDDGAKYPIALPSPDEASAVVTGRSCPHCGVKDFRVQGGGKRPSKDDRAWEADGFSVCCKRPVGLIRAEVNTLFGVREDAEVLSGRHGYVIE